MKVLKWLFGLVAALAVVVVVVALFLPERFAVERSVEVAAPTERVYALVEDPRQWARWTVWNRRDPAMQMSYSGAPTGAGAGWTWQSATEGSGAMQFTAAEPGQRIAYDLHFPDFDATSSGDLRFEATGGGTRVTWTMNGNMGPNFIFRWMSLFADRMIGPDFEAGLANLKAEAEKS